jgi:hypothetical protein
MPFDCQLVLSAEKPVNEIPVMSVAFGQEVVPSVVEG